MIFGLLFDDLLQDGHGLREVVHVLTVVPHHLLVVELYVCEKERKVGGSVKHQIDLKFA